VAALALLTDAVKKGGRHGVVARRRPVGRLHPGQRAAAWSDAVRVGAVDRDAGGDRAAVLGCWMSRRTRPLPRATCPPQLSTTARRPARVDHARVLADRDEGARKAADVRRRHDAAFLDRVGERASAATVPGETGVGPSPRDLGHGVTDRGVGASERSTMPKRGDRIARRPGVAGAAFMRRAPSRRSARRPA